MSNKNECLKNNPKYLDWSHGQCCCDCANLHIPGLIEKFEDKDIRERLKYLYEGSKLYKEEMDEMDKDSLISFFRLLSGLSYYGIKLKKPSISLTPNGTIWAGWREEGKYVLSLHFINREENTFIFILYAQEGKEKEKVLLTESTKSIVKIIAEQKKFSWMIKKPLTNNSSST